jgi:hypothetical protein
MALLGPRRSGNQGERRGRPPGEAHAQASTRKGKRFLAGDHTKYWCAACQLAYPIEVGAILPDVCPTGHRADDPELVEGAAPEADEVTP